MQRVTWSGFRSRRSLSDFIETEALPGTGDRRPAASGTGFAELVARPRAAQPRAARHARPAAGADRRLAPRRTAAPQDPAALRGFLREIGYLVRRGARLRRRPPPTSTRRSRAISGPQLVVPVTNARYALNAANARWGSLYDALYGTDAIPETEGRGAGKGYNPTRGAAVVAWARRLPRRAPRRSRDGELARRCAASRSTPTGLAVGARRTARHGARATRAVRRLPRRRRRRRGSSCCATTGCTSRSSIDDGTDDRRDDPAHVSDVWLEAALTAIIDCEDSVAAVDAEDKVARLPQLARADEGRPRRGGRARAAARFTRRLNPDLDYSRADDGTIDRPHAGR